MIIVEVLTKFVNELAVEILLEVGIIVVCKPVKAVEIFEARLEDGIMLVKKVVDLVEVIAVLVGGLNNPFIVHIVKLEISGLPNNGLLLKSHCVNKLES